MAVNFIVEGVIKGLLKGMSYLNPLRHSSLAVVRILQQRSLPWDGYSTRPIHVVGLIYNLGAACWDSWTLGVIDCGHLENSRHEPTPKVRLIQSHE
jgi:hypothetical protein